MDSPAIEKFTPSQSSNANSTTTGAVDGHNCLVCDFKCFSRETFEKHATTEDHLNKAVINAFLKSEKSVIGTEPATTQEEFEKSSDVVVGLNETYELYHVSKDLRFWICGVCYSGSTSSDGLASHLQGVKHKKRYIECQYPEKKKRINNKREMEEWLAQETKKIAAIEGNGMMKYALVLTDDIDDVLKAVGFVDAPDTPVETKAASAEIPTESGATMDDADDEDVIVIDETDTSPEPEIPLIDVDVTTPPPVEGTSLDDSTNLSIVEDVKEPSTSTSTNDRTNVASKSDSHLAYDNFKPDGKPTWDTPVREIPMSNWRVAMPCEACWQIVFAPQANKAFLWDQHISSSEHRKKCEAREKLRFDPSLFTTERQPTASIAKAVEQASKSSGMMIVGLDDVVETRNSKSDGNSDVFNVTCLLCAEKFTDPNLLSQHLARRSHKVKYLSKHFPVETSNQFNNWKSTSFSEMAKFLKERSVSAGVVRVYEPDSKMPNANGDAETQMNNKVDASPKPSTSISEPAPNASVISSDRKSSGDDEIIILDETISLDSSTASSEAHKSAVKSDKTKESDEMDLSSDNDEAPPTKSPDASPSPSTKSKSSETPKKVVDGNASISSKSKSTDGDEKKSNDAKASGFADKREWIYMVPIPDEIKTDAELVQILSKVSQPEVKNCKIRRTENDRRYAIMQAGSSAAFFIKNLNHKSLPGFTQQIVVEYSRDQKVGDKNEARNEDERVEDVAIKLLLASPTETIPIRYHAFAQPALDACQDPLIGVDEISEFCSRDLTYEPAYLCKLCRIRCICSELIEHLINTDHRLKYFERKYPAIYLSMTAGTSVNQLSPLQILAIKQHAQAVELEEGRARISQRLSVQVEPGTFKMKKASMTSKAGTIIPIPSPIVPPPFLSIPPPAPGMVPFGYRPPNMSQKSPDDIPPPPGVNRLEGVVTPAAIILPGPSAPYSKNSNMPLPPGVSAEDHRRLAVSSSVVKSPSVAWNSRCDQFLAKLTGGTPKSKNSDGRKLDTSLGSKGNSSASSTISSPKKSMDSPIIKKPTDKRDTASKKSRDRSMERKKDRRDSRSHRRSKSRSRSRRRSRSRSRSRSRGRRRSKSISRSRRRSKDDSDRSKSKSSTNKSKAKSRSPKRKSSPPKKTKDKDKKRRSTSPLESHGKKKKPRMEAKNDKPPSKKAAGKQSMEQLDLLLKLTDFVKDKKHEEAAAPINPTTPTTNANIGALIARLLTERASTSAGASTSKNDGGLGQLLLMLGGNKTAQTPSSSKAQPTTQQQSTADVATLLKIFTEEEDRKRRHQEQQTAIMALLSSKLGAGQKESSTGAAVPIGGAPPMVIDYQHGSKGTPNVQRMEKQSPAQPPFLSFLNRGQSQQSQPPKPMDAADELVHEALRKVRSAQNAAAAAAVASTAKPPSMPVIRLTPPVTTTSGSSGSSRPSFMPPFDISRPPPPIGGFRPMIPSGPGMLPPQSNAPSNSSNNSAVVNAAAAMLINSLLQQSLPPRG